MTKVYTDDNFMYLSCPDAETASWQNQLIDDYDLDYAPGERPYIGATEEQISAAYRIADKKRRETVLDNLSIDTITPEQWDAIDMATENIRKQYQDVDWSIAPKWARFWARDMDGSCRWYDSTPVLGNGYWRSRVTCDWTAVAPNFNIKTRGWSETLREREAALDEMTRDAEELNLYEEGDLYEELDLYDDEIVNDLTKPLSQQIGGDHYSRQKIQPVEFIHANDLGFCEGNCIKYLCRWQDKGGIQDLEKAKHYIELLMELEDDY